MFNLMTLSLAGVFNLHKDDQQVTPAHELWLEEVSATTVVFKFALEISISISTKLISRFWHLVELHRQVGGLEVESHQLAA